MPGDRPDRFDKAIASSADAVILDLEDAVALHNKVKARDAVCDFLAGALAAYGVSDVDSTAGSDA